MTTFDLASAAAFLGLHPDTLRERAARGIIRGAKIGRAWRFLSNDLELYFAESASARNATKPSLVTAKLRKLSERLVAMTDADSCPGQIYALQEDEPPHHIKVGYSGMGFESRIYAMQTGNPRRLVIIRHFPGSLDLEQMLLNILHPERIRGEWFNHGPITQAFIFSRGGAIADAILAAAAVRDQSPPCS